MEEAREKRLIPPMIDVVHSEDETGLRINVNLAGASKESLRLEMGEEGFCVKGEGDDFRYDTCHMLAHRVKGEEAKAKFESGLLTIHVPFEQAIRGHQVSIE
jgi:HSP20 family molecular chaperone IbpA